MRWHGEAGHLVALSAADPGVLIAARARLQAWGFRIAGGGGELLAWDAALESAAAGDATVVSRAPLAVADTYQRVSAGELAAGGAALEALSFAAPATVAGLLPDGATLVADDAAQGQIAWGERPGLAVAGSSAALVAALLDAEPDERALAGLALVGTGTALRTVFEGVRLLDMGETITLAGGRARTKPRGAAEAPGGDVAKNLRASVTAAVEAYPDAEFELSGGFDSRLLLAALPLPLRAGRGALTLGAADAPDVQVAAQLASMSGLTHRVLDPAALVNTLDGPELLARLLSVARCDDYALNPLDRLLFALLAEAEPAPRPRFSGQNGEILRGFYHAGQRRLRGPGTAATARRIVTWRMLANDRADARLFRPGWLADHEGAVVDTLAARLTAMPGADWGTQLDAFYLAERMHRWCGGAVSSAMSARTILLPFFEPGLVAAALAVRPGEQAGGRLAARLICELEPAFAAVPFDSGLTPAAIAAGGPKLALRRLGRTAGKAGRKVRQRLSRNAGRTVGGGAALARFRELGVHRLLDLEPVHRFGILDPAMLDGIATGRTLPDRATLGFVLNVCALAADVS